MTKILRAIVSRFARAAYLRYGAVSAVALAADLGAFAVLVGYGFRPALASGLAYLLGLAVHWQMSVRLVFAERVAVETGARMRQFTGFLASAGVGLLVTMAVTEFGIRAGLGAAGAKALAVAASFQCVWLIRSRIVFSRVS